MEEYTNNGIVEVKLSTRHGRGIFAIKSFEPQSILFVTYSWEISPSDISFIDNTTIEGFWFGHPDKPGWGLVPIGLAALLNCSLAPNAELKWLKTELGYLCETIVLTKISPGDEVLIDYGIGSQKGWID